MASQTDNTILSVQNITTVFESEGQKTEAIRNISFEIKKGKVLGIVGESGSGKSVASLSVMGLLPQKIASISNGKILFEDQDLSKKSSFELSQLRGNEIAMIFQEPMTSLNPVMKCGAQVLECLLQHRPDLSKKEGRKKVLELFEKVRLPNPGATYDKYPFQISGGQKQRIVIAIALICSPKLLIADEPTTALDVSVQKDILELLRSLQDEFELSMIFISHDLDVVKNIADHILVMYRGEMVEYGSVEKIMNEPDSAYTRGLVSCKPPIDRRPLRLPTIEVFTDQAEYREVLETSQQRHERLDKLYSTEPALKVKNLSVHFPLKDKGASKDEVFKAVDNVSFDVFKGETLGLVGESGCGKTTLSRSILRLIEPTEGEMFYDNRDLFTLSGQQFRQYRKKLQIIFQDPYSSLNPRNKIGKAITEPMKIHGIGNSPSQRKEMAIDLLEKTGMKAEHFDRFPHEFSGGQRQRIAIARTLSLQPELIICDESVSALDVSVQAQVLNLLNDLKSEFDLTYLFISHDLSVVKYMSDRIMVMQSGKSIEITEADELFANTQHAYTQKLISSISK